jgi:hypothetical protein
MLAEWNRTREMVGGDVVSGPVPTFFSNELEAAKTLANDPEKAFQVRGEDPSVSSSITSHPALRGLGRSAETKVKYDTYIYGIYIRKIAKFVITMPPLVLTVR